MRLGSFTESCLEENTYFSDKIMELINKPRQELDTLRDKDSWSYLRCHGSLAFLFF